MTIKPWRTTATVWDNKQGRIVTLELDVSINWQQIADRMARKALKSKHSKATDLNGALKAKIVSK